MAQKEDLKSKLIRVAEKGSLTLDISNSMKRNAYQVTSMCACQVIPGSLPFVSLFVPCNLVMVPSFVNILGKEKGEI